MKTLQQRITAERISQQKEIDALPTADGVGSEEVRIPLECPEDYKKSKYCFNEDGKRNYEYNFSKDDIKLGCELLNLRKKKAEPEKLTTYIHPRFKHHANKGDVKRSYSTHALMIEKYMIDAELYYKENGKEREVENHEIDIKEFDQNDWDIAVYMCSIIEKLDKERDRAQSRNTNIIMKEAV